MSKTAWFAVGATVLAVAAVVALLFCLDDSGSSGSASLQPKFPPDGPVEFLYLDATRVATYLAQVDGGEVESEKLSRKLTQNLSAKLSLGDVGEVGASQVGELLAEKNVKPTAASSLFALRGDLEDEHVISEIDPGEFGDVKPLREGAFVEFETSSLLPPVYINAYLGVLHAGTLAAIFPKSKDRRHESTNFFKKVGATPRAVFALQTDAPEAEDGAGQASASQGTDGKPIVYLLPFTASTLSSERSLLKYGGGKFTVLGKLVRLFSEAPTKGHASYVDSATRETWEQALRTAPAELLCRTAPTCAETVRTQGLSGERRTEAIEEARQRILETLATQTTIPDRGAVILPIAIYK